MDFDDDVLYCYEIQLEESCRGKGLGKFMMKVIKTFIDVYGRYYHKGRQLVMLGQIH